MRIPSDSVTLSIGDETTYQSALIEVIEAHCDWYKAPCDSLEAEHAPAYTLAEAAAEAAWTCLTAVVDSYVARRVLAAVK